MSDHSPGEDPGDLQIISDGEGIAVIGEPAAVELFVASTGQPSREIDLRRLTPLIANTANATQAASEVSANAGRWMKLTEESARIARSAKLVEGSGGAVQATTRGVGGQFGKNLQFVAKPGALLTNPAILAGAAGIMAQVAMQQTMAEITDYLAKIDAKVDDVLRAQKDAVFADMLGVEMMLDEAMTVRADVGRVSDVTWSKVQSTAATVARTQAYALRQLEGLAEKLERATKFSDLAELAKEAPAIASEWLAVLARCVQLQEASGILELDRVADASPAELDQHRWGLQTARRRRRDLIAQTTAHLIERMDTAASRANSKVLTNPVSSRVVVHARNDIEHDVSGLRLAIGLTDESREIEARRWSDAAADVRDDVVDAGLTGLQNAGRFGSDVYENARTSSGRIADRVTSRFHARRKATESDHPDTTGADE